ncbi:MAG: 6-bladed beta-propeller [Candidatus Micrarchaeota archaeon]|nr:6-bladed beta-propeller [Candidatus Micrarchaeota archaeon]
MRWWILLLVLGLQNAHFLHLGSYNGTNPDDPTDDLAFSQPAAVAVLGEKLFVLDQGNNWLYVMNASFQQNKTQRIRIVDPQGENSLNNPMRLAIEGQTIYIADGGWIKFYAQEGSNVERWNPATNIGKASGIAVGDNFLYITDQDNAQLVAYSKLTKSYEDVIVGKGGSDGQLSSPADVEFYKEKFYISDSSKQVIFVYSKNWTFEGAIGRGKGGVQLLSPRGIAIYEDRLYVADKNSNRVVVFSLDGYPIAVISKAGNLSFSYPEDVAVASGKLYVADSGNRMVHVFAINFSLANDSVSEKIMLAKQEAQALYRLQEVAKKAGLELAAASFEQELAEAQSLYQQMLFSAAESIAQRIIAKAKESAYVLGMQLDVRLKQMMKSINDRIASLKSKSLDSQLAEQLQAIERKSSEISSLLSDKKYVEAADEVLKLNQTVDAFAKQISSFQESKALEEKANERKKLESRKKNAEYRLDAIRDKVQKYKQKIDTKNLEKLLNDASREISEGLFDSARQTLELAEIELGAFESTLSANIKEIDAALANLSVIEFEINESASKQMLFPPNLSAQHARLKEAKEMAYSNPQLAVAMANRVKEEVAAKVKEAQTMSSAAAAGLLLFGLAGALAGGMYIYLKSRKK